MICTLLTVLPCFCQQLTSLRDLMYKHHTDKGDHHHYYLFYEPLLAPLRHEKIRILEIGVESGKSMALWEEYFLNAELLAGIGYGDQFDGRSCARKMRCFNGDQSDVKFLDSVIAATGGNFDIIIDDGSHIPDHQFVTLTRLLQRDAIVPNGLYVVEDVETSYWKSDAKLYGYSISDGGLNAPCSFVERAKRFVDVINREFVNSKLHTIGNRVDHRIATVQFAHNLVLFRVASEAEISVMSRSYRHAQQVERIAENRSQIISDMCDKALRVE